jgi:hypothetical protein
MIPQDNSQDFFPQDVSADHPNCPSIAYFKIFLERFAIKELIEKHLTDPRKKEGDYSFCTLIKTVLANCLFLCGSQNSFQTTARKTGEQENNVAHFIGSENEKIPDPKTIDTVMRGLDYEGCNDILMDLFEKVRESKLFFNHPELIPDGEYHLGCDAETIHTYKPGCDHDCENCPYCLKRTRDKTVWYNHTVLVGSLVSPGGFKLPIYVHPIKAEAVREKESASDNEHKQECELSAFKVVARIIRERFPKLRICMLLDSLYANGPNIRLLNEINFNYFIVRKDGSMPTVGEDCDGLMKLPDHVENNHVFERFHDGKGNIIEKKYDFFNDIAYQDVKVHIIRFQEKRINSKLNKIETTYWEWISGEKITKKNVAKLSARARVRWEEEDQFNTAECRGFNMRHDYSRNPTAQMAWVVFLNLAIGLEHLFIYTTTSVRLRSKMSIRDYMADLFHEIRFICKSKIDSMVYSLGNIQFRFSPIRKMKTWIKMEQPG